VAVVVVGDKTAEVAESLITGVESDCGTPKRQVMNFFRQFSFCIVGTGFTRLMLWGSIRWT